MDFSNGLKQRLYTAKTMLADWMDSIDEQTEQILSSIAQLNVLTDALAEAQATVLDGTNQPTDLINHMESYFQDNYNEDFSYNIGGVIPTGQTATLLVDYDAQLHVLTSQLLTYDAQDYQEEVWSIATNNVNDMQTLIDDGIESLMPNISVNDLCQGLIDTYTNLVCNRTACDLITTESFSAGELRARIAKLPMINSELADNIAEIFIDNENMVKDSTFSFLSIAKGICNKILSMNYDSDTNTFNFGVDTYKTETNVFLPVGAVLDIVSGVITVVTALVSPILAFTANVVGNLVSRIATSITENQSDTIVFNADPDIFCYGQNVMRGYQRFPLVETSEINFQGVHQACQVITPISNSITYNHTIENSAHQILYATQEFLIPFIPITVNAWAQVMNIFYASLGFARTNVSWNSDGDSDYISFDLVQRTGLGTSDVAGRRKYAMYLLRYMNSHPDEFHYCDEFDDEEVYKIGLLMTRSVSLFITGGCDVSFSSRSVSISKNTAANCFDNLRNLSGSAYGYTFFDSFMSFVALCYYALADDDYPAYNGTDDFNSWFLHLIFNNTYTTTYYLAGVIEPTWSQINNDILINMLTLDMSVSYFVTTQTDVDDTLYDVTSLPLKSNYLVYAVPPRQSVALWLRIALTIGVIAAAVITVVVVRNGLRRNALRSWTTSCSATQQKYQSWLASGSKSDYRAYWLSSLKTNLLGKFWHFGSYDVANNWVNAPTAMTAPLVSTLSGFKIDGDALSIEDVIRIINPNYL